MFDHIPMEKDLDHLKLFAGNANPALAQEIADCIGIPLGKSEVTTFSDGETNVQIEESVRGCDVFIVQPTCPPVNDSIIELLIMIDAMRRASARRITAVMPYFGYARQDRKAKGREPITAKLMANLITEAGAQRVLTMDLHAQQIQGFFDMPVDHLIGSPLIAEYFQSLELENVVVVSPDMGGISRVRKLAEYVEAPIAIIDKRRPMPNVSEVMNVIGDVDGKNVLMIDDIIDTAGTICTAANALRERGAKDIYVSCTHPVLSGPAIERLAEAPIKEVVTTDTIPSKEKELSKLRVLSVAPTFAEAILRIYQDVSVSQMFK